ncbi:MAG: hypothetical protein HC771_14445, partial [Synechococcales cyanobacterium CRU_2_2]|nr:hypothetical protein [Synechococcales cyanobacterium CRU_2_2]
MIDIFEVFSNFEELPDYRYYYTPYLFALQPTLNKAWRFYAAQDYNPDVLIPNAIIKPLSIPIKPLTSARRNQQNRNG